MIIAGSLALLAALAVPPGGEAIRWERSWEAALERARAEDRVLFVAVNMDGEAANERLARGVYRDRSMAALAQHSVNVVGSIFDHGSGERDCERFGSLTCQEHRSVEAELRRAVLVPDAQGEIVAPQHVFLKPDGTVILSVAYEVDRAGLEWCFVSALLAHDPDCGLELPEEARAPARVVMGSVRPASLPAYRPLSEEELERALRQLRKEFGALGQMRRFYRILATDSPDAVAFAAEELERGWLVEVPQLLTETLRVMGEVSPASFWEALAPLLESKDEALRNEAAVGLEQLGAPGSVRALKAALRREKAPPVQKNLLRALGRAGADDKAVRKELLKHAAGKDTLLATNALVALAWHRDPKVDEALVAALRGDDEPRRQAAALALALGRRADLREALREARDGLGGGAVLDVAYAVLDGGNLERLAPELERVAQDRIPRRRFFGASGPGTGR